MLWLRGLPAPFRLAHGEAVHGGDRLVDAEQAGDNVLSRKVLIGSMTTGAVLAAQLLPAAGAVAQTPLLPPAFTSPPPLIAPPAPVPVPQLTDAQATQLARLIDENGYIQGLRVEREGPAMPSDRDALVRAALDHARAVHSGRLATADFQDDWGLRPGSYDPLPAFADAVKRDRLAAWIASLPPPWVGYDALRKGLATYRKLAEDGGWKALPAGGDIVPGAKGAQVIALRKRLALEDSAVATRGETFDADLRDAVRRAQRRYGLNPTGTIGPQTRAALDISAADRVRQIMANMERWRWLPQSLPQRRIQVNIAAAVLTAFDGDQPIASMRAVTGRPGNETPMLTSAIHSVVLNPPWNVPNSIATKELWPKESRNPGYLKRNGYRVIATEGGGKRLQQASGPKSALGLYKFDFDNRYAVYLHDTPSQSTFARFSRLESHGCVRLERPEELAKLLLASSPDWGADKIDETIAGGKTVRARLAEPVAVYLLYWTAFGSNSGQVSFRDDPYDWDGRLAKKIEARSAAQAVATR